MGGSFTTWSQTLTLSWKVGDGGPTSLDICISQVLTKIFLGPTSGEKLINF